ncbi:MAG TPA: hypothetical protein VH089_23405 [Streptosporangiaceae bacterium]|nr:hypothetical protein [Streptosporangiaceae bacterium]
MPAPGLARPVAIGPVAIKPVMIGPVVIGLIPGRPILVRPGLLIRG